VLFPYNLAYDFAPRLGQAVAALREATESSPLSSGNIFVARLSRPRDAHALAELFPLAWLDAADPEHGFTLRRLARLGIACAHIAPPDAAPNAVLGPAAGLPTAFAITADEAVDITDDDGFGARLHRAAVPSVRQLAGLVRQTLAHPLAAVRPEPAAGTQDGSALAAFFAALEQAAAAGAAAQGAARPGPRDAA